MYCNYCGEKDEQNSQYCMKCGKPTQPSSVPVGETPQSNAAPTAPSTKWKPLRRKRALAISITVSVVLLAVLILILVLGANPVAGRWYSQGGTELILLKNGKGMTVTVDGTEKDAFMYAVEYKEAGYIEGEVYFQEGSNSTWFYLVDGKLEFNGEYFYRSRPYGLLG